MNLNARSPEFLSLYVDDKLRKGLKGVSEEETESVLDRAASLFRFLQEKDVFERYYKQHLSKRLLFGRSASDDAEKAFIVRLKTECGYQYTSKIEGMFNDMRVSRDAMSLFRKHLARRSADWRNGDVATLLGRETTNASSENTEKTQTALEASTKTSERVPNENGPDAYDGASGSIDLNVQVLTTGSWPVPADAAPCALPPALAAARDAYRDFYLAHHSGRKLSWLTSMGTAEVRGVFAGGAKAHDLIVSTHQMCVLLLFNDADALAFSEIAEATRPAGRVAAVAAVSVAGEGTQRATQGPADEARRGERHVSLQRRVLLQADARQDRHGERGQGERAGGGEDARARGRRPQAADRSRHRARDEGAARAGPQRRGAGGHQAAQRAVHPRPDGHQETPGEPHRARVHRARPGLTAGSSSTSRESDEIDECATADCR